MISDASDFFPFIFLFPKPAEPVSAFIEFIQVFHFFIIVLLYLTWIWNKIEE